MEIILRDEKKVYEQDEISCYEIAQSISSGLARVALCAKVDGELVDLSYKVTKSGSTVEILTFKDKEGQEAYRHTTAHILAQAVKTIYPTTKLAIGPAIENGFYYDLDFKSPITLDDFNKIEKEMKNIIKADYKIERFELSKTEAMNLMERYKEPYKIEIISTLPDDEKVSFYKQGGFVDLCKGPHIYSTGQIKSFKLTSLTGAYWRGNENNKMLSRIYGLAFDKKSHLNEYLQKLEEAKKRDHNKIGRELKYFMTDQTVGQGLPLLMPKGAKLFKILTRFIEDLEEKRGYLPTKTPYMAKNNLYKISGHWEHYKDGMFVIGDEEKDSEILALRPMTCPFQYLIYNNGLKSYRDLPVRYCETSTLFRNESSGEMHGLIRVRQFTLSEGHIICRPDQLEAEFKEVVALIDYIVKALGLKEDLTFRFSKHDPNDKEKYIDAPEAWANSERAVKKILDDLKLDYYEAEGEAAFYGPKLDIQIKNVYGKEDTIITVQVDMCSAEKFNMTYIDENGDKATPYIIHRSSIGCYERTIALLLEKYAGALPLWIAPEQVRIMCITDRNLAYAKKIKARLERNKIRVHLDDRSETIGYKVRAAKLDKIPYQLIVGDKEQEENTISVRGRSGKSITTTCTDFLKQLKKEIKNFK